MEDIKIPDEAAANLISYWYKKPRRKGIVLPDVYNYNDCGGDSKPSGGIQGTMDTIKLLVKGTNGTTSQVMLTALNLLHLMPTTNLSRQQKGQKCAYWASIIISVIPGAEEGLLFDFEDRLFSTEKIKIPEEAAANLIDVDNSGNGMHLYNHFCQACFILLEENGIARASYDDFMKNKSIELCDIIGLDTVSVPFKMEHAVDINCRMRWALSTRRNIVGELAKHIHKGDRFGLTCAYICRMFSWIRMDIVYCILNTLYRNESPVLDDYHIIAERMKFDNVMWDIVTFPSPQLYGFIGDYVKLIGMDGSRYPTLRTVAEKLSSGSYSTNNLVVRNMIATHLQHMRLTRDSSVQSSQNLGGR